jgi:hypothetical protein
MSNNNEKSKLEHSLATINGIGIKIDDTLEKRKKDATSAEGGVIATKELLILHKGFVEKTKASLLDSVKEGKTQQAEASIIMNWLGKSHNVIIDFLSDKQAKHNMKNGEIIAYDATVKFLKAAFDNLELKKKALEEITSTPIVEERLKQTEKIKSSEVQVEETKKEPAFDDELKIPKKRGRKRPDENGPQADTVRRLKESRKKNK